MKSKARVVRQRDQWVIIVDQSLIDEMRFTDETTLSVTTEGSALILTPEQDEERHAAFQASIEKMDQQYGEVFRRLAE